jgi:hypothetical protein
MEAHPIGDLYPEMTGSFGIHGPTVTGIQNQRKVFCGQFRSERKSPFSQETMVPSQILHDLFAARMAAFVECRYNGGLKHDRKACLPERTLRACERWMFPRMFHNLHNTAPASR